MWGFLLLTCSTFGNECVLLNNPKSAHTKQHVEASDSRFFSSIACLRLININETCTQACGDN